MEGAGCEAVVFGLVPPVGDPVKEIEGKTLKQLMRMLDDRVDAIVEQANQKWYEENDKKCRR